VPTVEIVETEVAEESPTVTPIAPVSPEPSSTQTPQTLISQAELNLITTQSVQIERTFEVRLPGLTQLISSTCELIQPNAVYCLSSTTSEFTESADSPQSYQIELWQSGNEAFLRQENANWQQVPNSSASFSEDEISPLLHLPDIESVNEAVELELDGVRVFEINYQMMPQSYLEKFMGDQASDLLQGATDLNFRGTAWVSVDDIRLVKQSAVLNFLKNNSWVHVESNISLTLYNEIDSLSVTVP